MRSGDWKGFIQAIIDNNTQEVDYYLTTHTDLNYSHPEMMTTPLIEAARHGHIEIAKRLLSEGASPGFESQIGETPIRTAKQNGHSGMVALLKKSL